MKNEKLIDLSDLPAPPKDTFEVYVDLPKEEMHWVETVVCCYDGIAMVRRDGMVKDGKFYYKIYVPPDFLEEFLQVLERFQEFISVGDYFIVRPA
jgi:hypothetical protein